MEKKLLSVLLVLLTGSAAVAQDITRFKVLSDSAYQTNTQYKSCNKYQKDAIIFMDLVADTHPYYVRPELREEWYAKKETLLEKCKSIETDEALADALNETLGKQKDKHTCVTTAKQVKEATLAERKKLTEAGITSFAPDREHIMRPHATVYDYQIFQEHSICYLQFNKCANNPADPFSTFLDRMFVEMKEAKDGTPCRHPRPQFSLYVSPHYYILQAARRGGLFWRLYTEIQTKRMLYRKSFVTLHPKAYEV